MISHRKLEVSVEKLDNALSSEEKDRDHFSFKRSDFMQPDFSPIDFIADRNTIPMDQFKADLKSMKEMLKSELVELINNDYANFIELSSNLTGVDDILKDLFNPLAKLKQEIFVVRDELQNVVHKINDRLDQRTRVKKVKQSLQTFISIHECVKKLTVLLAAFDQSDSTQTQMVKQIERIASEYIQLTYLVSKEKNHTFVKNLSNKIHELKAEITSVLNNLVKIFFMKISLGVDVTSEDERCLIQLVRIFASLEKISEFQLIFKQEIVDPFIDEVL